MVFAKRAPGQVGGQPQAAGTALRRPPYRRPQAGSGRRLPRQGARLSRPSPRRWHPPDARPSGRDVVTRRFSLSIVSSLVLCIRRGLRLQKLKTLITDRFCAIRSLRVVLALGPRC